MLLAALVLSTTSLSAEKGGRAVDLRVSLRDSGRPAASKGSTSVFFPATIIEDGVVCTVIDFEGVGDQSPIPEFDGISSPNWLGIIDADSGGSGNIAFEPSPQTVAFWLGGPDGTGSSRDVVFSEPAAVVEFFYASTVTVFLEAFDARGSRVASVAGGVNVGLGGSGDPTGQYNRWDRLRLDASDNRIVRIRVSGAVNRTAIDNLKVCRRAGVDTVEFTQAIQEIQDLDDLKADLRDGEPPVPLVRDKPAVMRVYFQEVQAVTMHRVEATFAGARESQSVTLQPGCDRTEQRQQSNGCASADFYFTPSAASVAVELKVTDSSGTELERHTFNLRPRRAEPLVLGAVKVCDSQNANGVWQCAENYRQRLGQLVPLLRKLAPTASVEVEDTGETVRWAADAEGSLNSWSELASEIDALSSIFDSIKDFLGIEDRRYYGIVRPVVPGAVGGMAGGIPSRGAASRSEIAPRGRDLASEVVSHETLHTLGRSHTDIEADEHNPQCFGEAPAAVTDWEFSDSLLRSRATGALEVGFDVAERRALAPLSTYDIMSYCLSSAWISPFTYSQALEQELTRRVTRRERTSSPGAFWLVSGQVFRGAIRFKPLFEVATAGPTDGGNGQHRLEVRSASGGVLFSRRFDPSVPETFSVGGNRTPGIPTFSELVPVQPGAASLVVRDPSNRTIGTLLLTGLPPSVTMTFPIGGEVLSGGRDVTWQTTDPDSGHHTYWLQYSANGGALGSWRTLGFVTETRLRVNFDQLAGNVPGSRSFLRVIASDGVRSTVAQSAAFTVATKAPAVQIDFPPTNTVLKSSDSAWLQASGFDAEDGSLADLAWRSNLNGTLGNGPSVPVKGLAPGTHRITVTGRDAEGKTASGEIQLLVAGAPPILDLRAEALDTLPTTCVEVTVGARAGSVPLRNVEYSLDGGGTWSNVPLANLPQRFLVPGRGFFHLVARAFDLSGQLAAKDERFFTESACQANVPQPPPGLWQSTGALPGYRFKARIGAGADETLGSAEPDCLSETLCLSGSLPGRSELFARVIGPRPNGFLWVNLVRFTSSEVEVWVERTDTGQINYYRLPAIDRESNELGGLVDKEAFLPGRNAPGLELRAFGRSGVVPIDKAPEDILDFDASRAVVVTSPEFPGFRFRVRIVSGGSEVSPRSERDCLDETVCISGAVRGRSELFLRLIGPRPNGFLWVNLVRFTTSRVEVEIEQIRTGRRKTYVLPELSRDDSSLPGRVDREAFRP